MPRSPKNDERTPQMNRKIATLAIALTATVGVLAMSVDSASARGGHGGGFGRGGHGGGMMRHGGGFRHGGFGHGRHFGWGYGGYYASACFYNSWGRLICTY